MPTTDDSPTEALAPETPRSPREPTLIERFLHLAEEVREGREQHERLEQKTESRHKDNQHALGEVTRTLKHLTNAQIKTDSTIGGLSSGLHELNERLTKVRLLDQERADQRHEQMLAAIKEVKGDQAETEGKLLAVDAARAQQDSLHDERLSQTQADVDETQAAVQQAKAEAEQAKADAQAAHERAEAAKSDAAKAQAEAAAAKAELVQVKRRLTLRQIVTYGISVGGAGALIEAGKELLARLGGGH